LAHRDISLQENLVAIGGIADIEQVVSSKQLPTNQRRTDNAEIFPIRQFLRDAGRVN
jgi:hypothetical protein